MQFEAELHCVLFTLLLVHNVRNEDPPQWHAHNVFKREIRLENLQLLFHLDQNFRHRRIELACFYLFFFDWESRCLLCMQLFGLILECCS